MPVTKVPSYTTLTDKQFIQVEGPDGIITGFAYDAQQRALYFKESQVLYPNCHGVTHIAEDPIPNATTDTPGLMSANDKAKLEALLQTRIGVLGYQGAGFPDDGGWMSGDLILAAGTEFISLERVGNVIRFLVDSPVPLVCSCEECTQIFWIQDETDVTAIRPPSCGGKLPGVNAYGELKVYLFPESTIVDPVKPSNTLQNKGDYPAFVFKRYDDSIVPGSAELEIVLKRDSENGTSTEIGHAFTPGASGVVQCVWFTGKDDDGTQLRFDLSPDTEPGLLGSVLYNGNLITKKMGVIVDYTSAIVSTNQYTVREWDVDNALAIGDSFTATNVWQYLNPENSKFGSDAQAIIADSTIDLLPVGTLVDLWFFKIGESNGDPIKRYYFSKRPHLNAQHLWNWVGQVQFGDIAVARDEVAPGAGEADKTSAVEVSAIRSFERSKWGLTGYDDPLLSFDKANEVGTAGADLTLQHRAVIDTSLPGLKVNSSSTELDNFSERPVWLWNRTNMTNALVRCDIGRPSSFLYTPFDVVFRADIDEHDNKYLRVVETGTVAGYNFIRVSGVHFHDLPQFGAVRIISETNENSLFNYSRKLMFPAAVSEGSLDSVVLASVDEYPGAVGDVLELLHQEYTSPVVRVEFSYDESTDLIEIQFKVGTLDMSLAYEEDDADDADDYVRGLADGYTVSAIYSQAGTFTGVGTQPDSSPTTFVVYDGGAQVGGTKDEYWNKLEVMVRDDQVWIWWNGLLVPPSPTLSASLPSPVTVDTPYFPITVDEDKQSGKVGMRLWPGATVRRMEVRSQLSSFSEYKYGQLNIV